MPAWLASALALLGSGLAIGVGSGLVHEGGRGFLDFPDVGGNIPGFFGGDKKKRRRRRRALTASDRADIAFITGLLGANAGKNFALTIATRA